MLLDRFLDPLALGWGDSEGAVVILNGALHGTSARTDTSSGPDKSSARKMKHVPLTAGDLRAWSKAVRWHPVDRAALSTQTIVRNVVGR
jgi:hypothetical protein